MTETKQTIQSNLKNPYLDLIMKTFNCNGTDKQTINKSNFSEIKLKDNKEEDKFYKKNN